jgi:hypothetical protein
LANVSRASELVATSSDGIVSALKNQDYSGTPLIQTNTNINHGNSGGPAFDGAGRVIGIATFGKKEAGFNFLVPVSTAMEFVRQAGAEPARGAFDKTWHAALDAYLDEDWSRAHTLSNQALEIIPGQPEALKLASQAAAREPSEPFLHKARMTPGAYGFMAIAASLVLVSGLVLWLALHKSSSTAPPAPVERIAIPASSSIDGARIVDASSNHASRKEEAFGMLHVTGGPLSGNRFPIPKAGLLIGRDPTKCSVVLPDDSISREHAWFVPLDNGVAVIDRKSANGIFVNSVDSAPIDKVILRHGDRVYLGKQNKTSFTYYSA